MIKVGVVGMIKIWVKEFGWKGINVNVVVFGFIEIDMVKVMSDKIID